MGINVNVELWGLCYLFMVVTVGITAGVVSKNKLAIPEESGPGDKTDSWGFEGPEQVVIYAFFFLSQHCVFTHMLSLFYGISEVTCQGQTCNTSYATSFSHSNSQKRLSEF